MLAIALGLIAIGAFVLAMHWQAKAVYLFFYGEQGSRVPVALLSLTAATVCILAIVALVWMAH